MTTALPYRFLAPLLVGGAAAVSTPALADPSVQQCLTASNTSLTLRSDHKMRDARKALLVCTATSCPAEVRAECARRLDQLVLAIPTIVFEVSDGGGHELSAVTVSMDGEPVARALDGTALTLDPGSHAFTFEAEGLPPSRETIILHEGDKNRHISVTLGPKVDVAAAVAVAQPVVLSRPDVAPPATTADDTRHKRQVLALGVGGVGAAGLVVGAIFGGLTFSAWSATTNACPTHVGCSSSAVSDHSRALTFGAVSDVGFIAGGALLAAGAVLYFTAPKSDAPSVGVTGQPGGAVVVGAF